MQQSVVYQRGIPEGYHKQAAELYEQAFGKKIALAIPDESSRVSLVEDSLQLAFGICAINNNQLVGLAGFQTHEGSLTGGITPRLLYKHLGLLGTMRALSVLSVYARKPREHELVMDGIAVQSVARGQGIGTGLLHTLKEYARQRGIATIRLDVIDTNLSARRLYEREGFVAENTTEFEFLRGLLGFGASTTMIYDVSQKRTEAN